MPPRTLILAATDLEQRLLEELGGFPSALAAIACCGFGPIAAAARTAGLLTARTPQRVLLVGIAGSLAPDRAPVGDALAFGRVLLEGVGVGEGPDSLSPSALGFVQWDDPELGPVYDDLPLASPGPDLLTVCSASATPAQAAVRRGRFPEARAEDMEGFGVALACRMSAIPLVVVRGLSNTAGVRAAETWRVREALTAARELALSWLGREDWGPER